MLGQFHLGKMFRRNRTEPAVSHRQMCFEREISRRPRHSWMRMRIGAWVTVEKTQLLWMTKYLHVLENLRASKHRNVIAQIEKMRTRTVLMLVKLPPPSPPPSAFPCLRVGPWWSMTNDKKADNCQKSSCLRHYGNILAQLLPFQNAKS